MPTRSIPVLTLLSALVLTAVVLTVGTEADEVMVSARAAGPLTVAPIVGCDDLVPALPGIGPIAAAPGAVVEDAGVVVAVDDTGTVEWRSEEAVRAALIASRDRAHLYWYEPPATEDAGLRVPVDPDQPLTPPIRVELCVDGEAQPDLVAVCIRAGHLPIAGPSTYADGAFDGALGDRITVNVDPDDGTFDWRSDGPDITAVVTATSAPVLVEYDPPTRSGTDVPFLGRDGATGTVLFCGVTTIRWDDQAGGPSRAERATSADAVMPRRSALG